MTALPLYPHQKAGVDWLLRRRRSLLCDQQGLGKTITAIRYVAALDSSLSTGVSYVLVVCPTVVLWNWAREFEKWWPGCRVQVIEDGSTEPNPAGVDVVIVTHGLLLSPFLFARLVRCCRWDLTILDEAHFFRSPEAQRTAAFYGVDAYGDAVEHSIVGASDRVLCMTGTPMPNNAAEVYMHFRGLFPERIMRHDGEGPMSYAAFRNKFCRFIPGRFGRKCVGNNPERLDELRAIFANVSLRRLASQVLDLPPIRFEVLTLKGETRFLNDLGPQEAIAYALEFAREQDPKGDPWDTALRMMRDSTPYAEYRKLCGLAKIAPVVELMKDELDPEFGELDKVVIFAHHKEVVAGIAEGLAEFGALTITGATPGRMRALHIAKFQTDPKCRVIVCNILAGGTGATLTASADVVMAEMSFVPGENSQAAYRVYRIGQTKRVRIRCIALAGTSDEDVTAALTLKTRMIREVLDA